MVSTVEELPVGVGRVPKWWMEITPHYTLDEEDAEARRLAEDQMDYYYMQLAAADEAGLLNPDGTPKEGADMSSWAPSNPWNGRSGGGNAHATAKTPGGRNFQPGQAVIDPKIFGIYLNDPDYKAYLTGAKLPPGYFEKMGEFARCTEGGAQGILNNLKQTDYGRYGRQAETPSFKPAWAKKKLRSTSAGTNIRQGQYDDSPNKHINRRRVQPQVETPSLDDAPESHSRTPQSRDEPMAAPVEHEEADPVPEPHTMIRTVRTVVRTDEQEDKNTPASKAPTLSEYMHEAPPVETSTDQKLREQKEKLARLKELQRQQRLLKEQREKEDSQDQQHSAPVENEDEESYEEEIIEEEILDDDDEYTEGSYEEEIIEDGPQDKGEEDDELNNLQAILAAKQAELQRLKAQM